MYRYTVAMIALAGALFAAAPAGAHERSRTCATVSARSASFAIVSESWGAGAHEPPASCRVARRVASRILARGNGGRVGAWMCAFGNDPVVVCWQGASGGRRVSASLRTPRAR
jgi:hypothetical protein